LVFDKLTKLKNINLLNTELKQVACTNTNMQSKEVGQQIQKYIWDQSDIFFNNDNPDYSILTKPKVCLDGIMYEIISNLGSSGEEGFVYNIKKIDSGEELAMKLYKFNHLTEQHGDWLALLKARESKQLLVLPLVVNIEYGYSIFPVLKYGLREKHSSLTVGQLETGMVAFKNKLNPLLKKDGMRIGDNLNTGNYMYDFDDKLKRIDFGSLRLDIN